MRSSLSSRLSVGTILAGLALAFPYCSLAQGAREVPSVTGPIQGHDAANHAFDAAPFQAMPIDLGARGYDEDEYFLSGTANVYQYRDVTDSTDSAVKVLRHGPYTNRILVRRPVDPKRFSGNVIVELLNATNNYDLPVFWSYDHDQFLARGDIWIGITSKPVAMAGLKKFNPTRYAPLSWANPDPAQNASTCPVLQSVVGGASLCDRGRAAVGYPQPDRVAGTQHIVRQSAAPICGQGGVCRRLFAKCDRSGRLYQCDRAACPWPADLRWLSRRFRLRQPGTAQPVQPGPRLGRSAQHPALAQCRHRRDPVSDRLSLWPRGVPHRQRCAG